MPLRKYLAYTLIELLVTVAVIGSLATGAYLVVRNVREASANTKLEQDVRKINESLKVYQTHGGRIPSGLTGDQVLSLLRRSAANAFHAGLKSKMIDSRMTIRWQAPNEVADSTKRAYWDDTAKQFVIAESGSTAGVKEFYFGDEPAPLPTGVDAEGHVIDPNADDRQGTKSFDSNNKWVWNFEDGGNRTREAPETTGTGIVDQGNGDPQVSGDAVPLAPPNYSEVTGRYDISWFPGTITLTLPPSVPANAGEIYFHTVGGPLTKYTAPISVQPGDSIWAKTVSLDLDKYSESVERLERYDQKAMKLLIAGQFSQDGYNYKQLGGTMQGAAAMTPPYAPINITNLEGVPADQISSDKFQIHWTYDGSDPLTSGTRLTGPIFTGTYNPVSVPVTLSHYGASGTVTIRVRAKALDTEAYADSDELVLNLGRIVAPLPPVTMSLSSDKVVMASITADGTLPADSRIYYTSNGSDPGDNAGEPAAAGAVSYSGPVTPPSGTLTEYNARTYAPTAWKDWFSTSGLSSIGTGTTPDGNYFAVSSGDNKLYQFDSLNGNSIVRTSECIYPPAAVAYVGATGRVYYVEQASSGWHLGMYDLATGVHTPAGGLVVPGLDYVPETQPRNLVAAGNSVYYAAEGTDDLIRVDFTNTGTIRAQYKYADMTDDTVAFNIIGDITTDNSQNLYLAASNALATFNLGTLASYSVPVTSPAQVWTGLVASPTGTLYGVSATEPGKFYNINKTTAVGSSPVTFSPARSFDDFGGPVNDVLAAPAPGHFAVSETQNNIYRLNVVSGRQTVFADLPGYTPSAIAHDRSAGVFYTLGSLASAPSDITLGRYTISSGTFTPLGSLTAAGQGYLPASTPGALTWFNGGLYYVAPGTDDLVKITPAAAAFTQVKVDDINDNGSMPPSVDAMSVGPDGELYMASKSAHWLATYGISSGGGLNVIKSAEEARYAAITFSGAGQLYGVPSHNDQQIWSVDDTTGAQSGGHNVLPPVAFSDITGWFDSVPAPVTENYFAVDGTTSRIYRFNPATGANTVLTTAAPWPLGAVAYDSVNQKVYYTRAGGYEAGVYSVAAGTHTTIGSLNTGSYSNPATVSPRSLTFFNGSLYYVAPGSDDLMRVEIKPSGDIADVWKDDDINNDVPFGDAGDLAVNASGIMYLSTPSVFASYNLLTLSGYTVLNASPAAAYEGLFIGTGSTLNGIRADDLAKIQTVNAATGASTQLAAISPVRRFVDTASSQPAVATPAQAGAFYATAAGKKSIYRLDLPTGDLTQITASAPYEPEAIAFDPAANVIYYTVTSSVELYKYEISTRLHTLLGTLSSSPGTSLPAAPRNLTFFLGNLYTIPMDDDLMRIDLNAGGTAVTGLTKIGDVSGNTKNIGNAGALTVDNTGIAWVARDDTNLLGKFNFYARGGYFDINTTSSRFTGLTFDSANVLHGTPAADRNKINSVSQVDGALTFVANTTPSRQLKDISGINTRPIPLLPECYAVGGGNKNIYQFDPATGANYTITTDAPFNLNCIARDPARDMLYYLENTNSNWRLGRYDVGNHTHTVMATLGSGAWTSIPASRPNNLFCWDGNLFFIAPNSDDLYQVTLDAAGTSVTAMTKVDDISFSFGTAYTFTDTGDVAVGTDARASLSGGGGVNGYFNMFSHKEMTVLGANTQNWLGLLINESGTMYGTQSTETGRVYQIDRMSGAAGAGADTFPSIAIWDMAGEEPGRPASASNSMWAISENTGHLGEFQNWNLVNVTTRDWGEVKYLSNGVATAFTGGFRIESLAVTDDGTAYFVRNIPTTVNGVTYDKALFKLNTGGLVWGASPTPPVANFVGDLKSALSVLGAVSSTASEDDITGLAVAPDQKLYALYNRGTASTADYLIRFNSFAVNAANALSNISIIGQLTGAGETVTSGQDLVFSVGSTGSESNTLYVTDDSDDEVYAVDYKTGAITSVFSNDASAFEALAAYTPTGEMLGGNSDAGSPANSVRTIRSGANNDTTRFNASTISGGAMADVEGMSFPRGPLTVNNTDQMPNVFAVDQSTRIYRVNPATGVTTIETSTALFNADAVAYDAATGTVYYLENSDSTIRLAKYSGGSHTLIGDLKSTGAYRPVTHPQHLVFYGDSLYYINNGTGNLVRVQLNAGATAVTAQTKAATLSSSATWTVTAAALNNSGILYFQEGTNQRSYDLRSRTTLSAPITTAANRQSLLHVAATGAFYASETGALAKVSLLNSGTGSLSNTFDTTPAVSLYDMAGGSTAPAPVFVDSTSYLADGSANIFMVDPATGENSALTTTELFSSISAVACDATGTKVYYLQEGSPYKVGVYDRATDTHTLLASLNGASPQSVTAQPKALTWFNNHLYAIPQGTDDLIKVELLFSGAYSRTLKVADIAGSDAAFGTVGDIAVDSTGMMFIAGSTRFAKYNLASFSGYTSLATSPAAQWTGLMFAADGTTLYGTQSADATRLYTVNKTTGAASGTSVSFLPSRTATDMAAPQQPVTVQLAGQRYMVSPGANAIYRLDLDTAADYSLTESLSGQPSAIAHAYSAGVLYVIGYDGAVATPTDIYLEAYNLSSGYSARVGSIRAAGLSYPATAVPRALLYAGDRLYYVHPATDDLVEITLNVARTAVASTSKVADMNGNTSLGTVDALTFASDGTLYLARSDADWLATYNFRNRNNLTVLRNTATAKYNALTFSDANLLHGVTTAADTSLQTLSSSPWAPVLKATAGRAKSDITGLSGDSVSLQSLPLWSIVKNSGNTVYQLARFNNYDGGSPTVVNYGNITYTSSGSPVTIATSAQAHALTITDAGVAYFVISGDITVSGSTVRRGLFSLNVGSLVPGNPVLATYVGDLEPQLRTLLGSGSYLSSQWVTGLAIQPGTGMLYGLLQDGTSAQADRLFRINALTVTSGNINDIALVGTLTGAAGTAGLAQDISFAPDGTLYVSDSQTNTVYTADPGDGSLDAAFSAEASYGGLAVNTQDNAVIGSQLSATTLRRVVSGPGNDSTLFDYLSNFSLGESRAISFVTYAVTFTPTPTTLYFAVNGTTTIYALGIPSAVTSVVTTGALFPASAVAYDPDNNVIYYSENVASGFRLAKYDRNTSTHTLLGNLDTGSYAYDPSTKPANLEYYGGSLYYVHYNTDDLVRVDLNAAGTAITSQWKIADITANASNFGNQVTDIAIDKDGIAYLSAIDGLHKYDLVRLNGYQLVKTGAQYAGVIFAQNGTDLYGTSFTNQNRLYSINKTVGDGTMTEVSTSSPSVTFEDFAGYPPAGSAAVGGAFWAVNGSRTLYKVDPNTGAVQAVSASAPYNMAAVAYDFTNNWVYYSENVTTNWRIGRYDVATGSHTDLGYSTAAFAANGITLSGAPGSQPNNLFCYNSQVYFIAPGTDDLMRVEFNTARTGISFYYRAADITGNAASFTSVGDVTEGSTIYFPVTDNAGTKKICKFTMTTLSGYADYITAGSAARDWRALLTAGGNLYGVAADLPATIYLGSNMEVAGSGVAGGLQFTDFAVSAGNEAQNINRTYMTTQDSPAIFTVNANYGTAGAGQVRLISASAPFNISGIAYDNHSNSVWYTENSTTSFRLGRYDLRGNVHYGPWDMKTGWDYNATGGSKHLVYYLGDLYYINKDTDDLVRITVGSGTPTVASKWADITGDRYSLGTVDAASIDGNGFLRFVRNGVNGSTRYNFLRRSGYSEFPVPLPPAVTPAALKPTAILQSEKYNKDTATSTIFLGNIGSPSTELAVALSPALYIEELSDASPVFPHALVPDRFYATDRSKKIYEINPATGANAAITWSANMPFNIEGIAYDYDRDVIYATEVPGEGFRVGRYDAGRQTAIMAVRPWGNLQNGTASYIPALQPRAIVYFNRALYYIAPGTDDLVRVVLGDTEISTQQKVADISNNASTFEVTAMSLKSDGLVYFTAKSGAATNFYSYNLLTLPSSVTLLAGGVQAAEGLVFSQDSTTLYGTSTATPDRIGTVNTSSGVLSSTVSTNPVLNIAEITGLLSTPPTATNGAVFYAANGSKTLFRVDGNTGAVTTVATWTTTGNYNFESVAWDKANGIIYFSEAAGTKRLGKYTISTNTFANINTLGYNTKNLFWYKGGLYYIRDATDSVYNINTTTPATQTLTGIINGGVSPGTVYSVAINETGAAYYSTATKVGTFNMGANTISGQALYTITWPQFDGLAFNPADGTFYGTRTGTDANKICKVYTSSVGFETLGKFSPLVTSSPSTSFTDITGGVISAHQSMTVPPVYAVGDFYRNTTNDFRNIARFTSTGALDTSFAVGSGFNSGSSVPALARLSTGKVLAGGSFTSFNGTTRASLAMIRPDGALDTTFAPAITNGGNTYTLDWGGVSIAQDAALTGADTSNSSPSSATHGLATGGAFTGFASQTLTNVGGSGVNVTLRNSQNMNKGGAAPGAATGPSLYSPSGSGGNAGVNPDARVTGPWDLVFTGDRSGTITPATLGLDFSEAVYIESVYFAGLSQVNSQPENLFVRAWSGASTGGSLVPASEYSNQSAATGPVYGTAADPLLNNLAANAIMDSNVSDSLYLTQGGGHEALNRLGRTRMAWTATPVQSLAASLWAPAYSPGRTIDPAKPLGVTQDYAAFAFGNVAASGNILGGVASGGNAALNSITAAGGLDASWNSKDTLVVGGTVDYAGVLAFGKAAYATAGTNTFTTPNGSKRTATGVIDFAAEQSALSAISAQWAAQPTTSGATVSYGVWTPYWSTITLNGGGSGGLIVFNVEADKVNNAYSWTATNIGADATVIVNILGDTVSLTNKVGLEPLVISGLPPSRTIINCPSVTRFSAVGVDVPGTVLAPSASFILSSSAKANGTVIASSISVGSGSEIRWIPFVGNDLSNGVVTAGSTIATTTAAHISKIVFRKTSGATPGSVWAIAEQSDGKIVIAGNFTHVGGVARKNIARLNADGTLDTTFDPGTGPDAEILALDIRSDGKIHAAGDFTTWNGVAAGAKVVLLSATGARETGFTSPVTATAGSPVKWVKAANTTTAYIGGKFAAPKTNAAKINSTTGATTTTWNTGAGPNDVVNTGLLTNGSAIITLGGNFTTVDGVSTGRVVRIGSGDSTFTTSGTSLGTGFDGVVNALTLLTDTNYVHVAGAFANHSGSARTKLSVYENSTLAPGIAPWGSTGMTITTITNVK